MEDLSFCLGEPWRLAEGGKVSLGLSLDLRERRWEGWWGMEVAGVPRIAGLLFLEHGGYRVSGMLVLYGIFGLFKVTRGCGVVVEAGVDGRWSCVACLFAPRLLLNGGEQAWWGCRKCQAFGGGALSPTSTLLVASWFGSLMESRGIVNGQAARNHF